MFEIPNFSNNEHIYHPEVGVDLLLGVGIDPDLLLVLVSEARPQDQSPSGVEALRVEDRFWL